MLRLELPRCGCYGRSVEVGIRGPPGVWHKPGRVQGGVGHLHLHAQLGTALLDAQAWGGPRWNLPSISTGVAAPVPVRPTAWSDRLRRSGAHRAAWRRAWLHGGLIVSALIVLFPFVWIGACPDTGGHIYLQRSIGHQRAAEMMMLGPKLKAKQVADQGLFISSWPTVEGLLAEAMPVPTHLAEGPPRSQQVIREPVNPGRASGTTTRTSRSA